MQKIEKWGVLELSRPGKNDGNPFRDYKIIAVFKSEREEKNVTGFYDGDGVYKVRFMPSYEGIYTYHISGNFADYIEEAEGSFEVCPATIENHGPVVTEGTHLRYVDGSAYHSIGTTCYAWVFQPFKLQEQTLASLRDNAFNKIRFCLFPKFYDYNKKEPLFIPFERGSGEGLDPELVKTNEKDRLLFPGQKIEPYDFGFDYTRPNVELFRLFDKRIAQLQEMGIEADLILMHPYDKWGMNQMGREACDQYLRYVVARYGAYRNVWWSLANEYDFILAKKPEDWEHYGELVSAIDSYGHMLSVHNGVKPYEFSRSWITHCSLQRTDFYVTTESTDRYLEQYHKPVVWDEISYEGNLEFGWGNITAQELVRRFWEGAMRGAYCGHGETYLDEVIWWSHGGMLKGQSPARLRFLLEILKEVPGIGLSKGEGSFDEAVGYTGGHVGEGMGTCYDYSIHYLGFCQPVKRMVILPENAKYQVDLIDTWNMTITPLGEMSGFQMIEMPGRQYMAIRIRKVAV